jgi:hypothetical protein
MTANRWQLVISTPKPARAARFWCHALSYAPQPPPHGYVDWDHYSDANGISLRHGTDIDAAIDPTGRAPRLLFIRDNPDQRGAISLEILTATTTHPATLDAIVQHASELAHAGATHHTTVTDHEHPWAQLRDPDGHPFRII